MHRAGRWSGGLPKIDTSKAPVGPKILHRTAPVESRIESSVIVARLMGKIKEWIVALSLKS